MVLALGGCPDKQPPPAVDAVAAPEPPAPEGDPAVDDIPFDQTKAVDPARMPKAPERLPAEVAVRTIVVGATARSKADARRRAARLVAVARQQGSDFAELARKYSEVAEERRGVVAVVMPSDEPLQQAFQLGLGQVSEPIETEDGFSVVQRVELEEYSSAHILIMYRDAKLAPVGFKRKKADAAKLAERVLKKARKPGVSFAALAARNSDSPSKTRGGVIAPLVPGKLIEGFEPYLEAVKQTEPGQVHDKVVETPYGFHVIKRLPLEKIWVQHILIAYEGSEGKPKEKRRKKQAEELAAKLLGQIREGADFDELARQYSEDAGSAQNGGRLRPFARGEMVPRFEQFAFALEPGQLSDLVDTPYGFHVIKRLR